MPAPTAQILLPNPLKGALDYTIPDGMDLHPGDQVLVPLGRGSSVGVVVSLAPASADVAVLKPVTERLDRPPFPDTALAFYQWAGAYTAQPPGVFLRFGLRGAEPAKRPSKLPIPQPNPDACAPDLTPSQRAAAARLCTGAGRFTVALLDGVTGAGKTETYMEVAADILRNDPTAQVLVLCPEIALTAATLARLARRFGADPLVWHADVAEGARKRVWQAVATGAGRLVIGARSALFLPFRNVQLIIVDEEHDASYKQDDGVHYHARDLSVARAKIEGCLCILASATPSLETLYNAQRGRYMHVKLSERIGDAVVPDIALVDMRAEVMARDQWLSPTLRTAMAEVYGRGEQSLVFLNRRGFAPVTLCRACGHRMTAPDSDTDLVYHKRRNRLVCHLTGFSIPMPPVCPKCKEDALISVGPGVERVADEVRATFPEARVAVMSSDITDSADEAHSLIAAMTAGEIDILVATQMAAKGHNFPKLTLVGVVDADLGLKGGDLRAGERTFQVLHQVAGRAGRFDHPGRALIQTYQPDHPAMQALAHHDRDAFCAAELELRQAVGLPPFGRLVAVIVSGQQLPKVEAMAAALARAAPRAAGFDLYGPAEPIHARVRGLWRRRLLLRADKDRDVQAYIAAWRAGVPPDRAVTVVVDVDPQNFY